MVRLRVRVRMSSTGYRAASLGVAALLLIAPAAWAQTTSGSLVGVVKDSTGAVLPGVTVTARHAEMGVVYTRTTNEDGGYRIPEVPLGTYEVTAALDGFRTDVRRGVAVTLGGEALLNFTLELGTLTEDVVVTGAATLVDVTHSGVTSLVDTRQIQELPLNGRDFSQLTLLQPGIVSVPTAGRTLSRGMGTQVSVAGARANQISYLLDGTDINDQGNQSPGSAAGGMLGVDSIREFQVLTNTYSAEYGRSAGGVVSAVTRSGSNVIHGGTFEFFRHDALDAKNYFDPADEPIPPFTRHQYGFNVGGPIRQNRTFFFGAFEGLHQDKGLTMVARVPSRAVRARTDVNPIVRPYLELYPLPNGGESGQSGLFLTSDNEPAREQYVVGKVDHTFSSADSGFIRYTFDNASVLTPRDIPIFSVDRRTRNQYLALEERHIFSNLLLNVFRGGFNRTYQATENIDNVSVPSALDFIPDRGMGALDVTGWTQIGSDSNAPNYVALNTIQLSDSLTWQTRRHALKFGTNWTYWIKDELATFTYAGRFAFTSVENFLANRANTFEGGVPGLSQDRYWRQHLFGFYVQDDITVSSRLTLNAGVRYEFITTPKEKYDRVANLRTLSDRGTTVGYPLFENPSLGNVAPRGGFAWNVTGDGKTSVRGGAGLFYEPILANYYRTLGNANPPFFRQANVANPTFPHALATPDPRLRLDLLQYDLKNPYSVQFNATLQREVLPQVVVTAGYIGSRGHNLIRNVEANQAVAQVLADGRYFFPVGSLRRNPAFQSIRVRRSDGSSSYNGMILGVSKRFALGLQFQGSYTYGKAVDDGSIAVGSNDLSNGFQPRYADDRDDNRGLADFDIRHNFVFNYSYEVPGADAGGAGWLLRGWQVAGIVTLRSGVPFTPVLGFDRARALPRSGGAGQRPDMNPAFRGDVMLGRPERYFDPNAFALPEAGFFGALGRNTFVGPGFATWDASVFRNIQMSGVRLQLRLEVFNLLNRANFGLPETTVFSASGLLPTAGEITETVGTSRQIQLGVKVEF